MSIDDIQDRKLAHLHIVTDAALMAARFAASAPELATGITLTHCAIEKIYYRPAHSCTVLYRLHGHDAAGARLDQWVCGKVYPSGRAHKRFAEALALTQSEARRRGEPNSPWQPVSFWRDLDMVLWVFPHDAKLPILTRLVETDFVKNEINAGLAASSRAGQVTVERIKYMPGKRCVLRYACDGVDGKRRRFYSKTYFDGKSRYHFQLLQKAYEYFHSRPGRVQIPRPLRHLEGCNTIWQEEWQGQALLQALETQEWPALFSRLTEVAADLHDSALPDLPPGPDLEEALKVAVNDGAELGELLPALQEPVAELLGALSRCHAEFPPAEIPRVPIHGAFRLEQMLMRGEEFAVVDFDALACGDPWFDAAEFVASLQFLELSHGFSRPRLHAAAELFVEEYAQRVPWRCDRRRLAWYVLAFLISKMFLAVKNLDRRALQELDSAGIEICNTWLAKLG